MRVPLMHAYAFVHRCVRPHVETSCTRLRQMGAFSNSHFWWAQTTVLQIYATLFERFRSDTFSAYAACCAHLILTDGAALRGTLGTCCVPRFLRCYRMCSPERMRLRCRGHGAVPWPGDVPADVEHLVLDAQHMGNVSRFLKRTRAHAGNVAVQPVLLPGAGSALLYGAAFFASRDIPAMTELRWGCRD